MSTTAINKNLKQKLPANRTLGPVADLERHLPAEWWKNLFNSLYLKTDGDVVENNANTVSDIDLLIDKTGIKPDDHVLDLCCGQGRHSLELARRGYHYVTGIDRSRYLVRLARKRARQMGLAVTFSEGDARKFRLHENSQDCVCLMGNSFGYFEREEDDLAVLDSVKKVLRSKGRLVLDIVDGNWMRDNFELRSWEWLDQNHFVCRERSLAMDGKRIVSREVVTDAESGVIADQFYAERLYSFDEIETLLDRIGFCDIENHGNVTSDSTRGQDLGMMANRLFITARAPVKLHVIPKTLHKKIETVVIMGDPRLPDSVKKNGQYNDEDFKTVNILKDELKKLDDFSFSYVDNHRTMIKRLIDNPPAFVFNLCDEGYHNNALFELHVPAVLDMLGIQYTGAGPACLATCYNKAIVRAIAADIGIPVPLETYYDPSDQAANIPSIFPALLKPSRGDGSIGITSEAVVHNARELIAYLAKLRELMPGMPVLIQEFLSGAEYTVALIGNPGRLESLPILEIDYSNLPESLPKLLAYESKWVPESPYWHDIKYKEAELDEDTRRKMLDYATVLFERLDCRDYARFDFREDGHGVIKLLEVNPNPGWCWDGKFNLMAGFANIEYHELLDRILKAARDRIGIKSPVA